MPLEGSLSSDEELSKPSRTRKRLKNHDENSVQPISSAASTSASTEETVRSVCSSIVLEALTATLITDVLQDYTSSGEDNDEDDQIDDFVPFYSSDEEENDLGETHVSNPPPSVASKYTPFRLSEPTDVPAYPTIPKRFPSSDSQQATKFLQQPSTHLQTNTQPSIRHSCSNFTPTSLSSRRELRQSPAGQTSYHYFRLLFTNDFVDAIVTDTNLHAQYLLSTDTSRKGRIKLWKDLTREEFLVFLGITYHTGTLKCSRLSSYWSTKDTRNGLSYIPVFGETMTRDRYLLILRCLSFARNPAGGQPNPADRLHQIRPVIDYFNRTMNSVFKPTRDVSIDKSMVLWRGRLLFRQDVQAKRHKCIMRLYVLADSCGLALKFLSHVGTWGADKDVHKLLDGACIMKWRDKREVLTISSESLSTMEATGRPGVAARKPLTVKRYNKWLNGVDQIDRLLVYYPCESKSLHWHKKLAFHVFQMLLTNSHLLYNSYSTETKIPLYDFRLDIIETLMAMEYPNRPTRSIPTIVPASPTAQHYPCLSDPSTSLAGRYRRKTCRYCKRTTKYFCSACPSDRRGEIGLCPECFREYHEH